MTLRKFLNSYGTLLILLLLCAFLSWRTMSSQTPEGASAGKQVADKILEMSPKPSAILIAVRKNETDLKFSDAVSQRMRDAGIHVGGIALAPADLRKLSKAMTEEGRVVEAIACTEPTAAWTIFGGLGDKIPELKDVVVFEPSSYRWPIFLNTDNLINISNQIVVIATIAIGMTMVIITGGIDLSVGSLIALSSCIAAWCMREWAGGETAGVGAMVGYSILAVSLCAIMGLFTGTMVTLFSIPPFIVTLGNMMVASGLAYIISGGYSIYQIPWGYTWLGRGVIFGGLPVSVAICGCLYFAAHILMTRMSIGRYIYAVGGNREAARLSGVPVRKILFFVYIVTACLAAFGGIITASQLKTGAPIYGVSYEMYVIASVVVGGTSLDGGEGKIFGTLVGALIIAVIQNGMNLLGVESYTQKVILGLVILGAVLLDRLKQADFRWLTGRMSAVKKEAA